MSSPVGFSSNASKNQELEKLREAVGSLNDALRTINAAVSLIEVMNFGLAKDNLKSAEWHVREAKKAISVVGQTKKKGNE